LTKSIGSSNPHNVVKATMKALTDLLDVTQVARKKEISYKEVYATPIS
jgi:small subunit ribosomal protein S5